MEQIPGDEPFHSVDQPFEQKAAAITVGGAHPPPPVSSPTAASYRRAADSDSSDEESEALFELSEREQERVPAAVLLQHHHPPYPWQRRREKRRGRGGRSGSSCTCCFSPDCCLEWHRDHDPLDEPSPVDRAWGEWVRCFRSLGRLRVAIFACLVLGAVGGVVGLLLATLQPILITPCGHCNPTGTVDATIHCSTNNTVCGCSPGWVGVICERCDRGYSGSPRMWGGCVPIAGYFPPPAEGDSGYEVDPTAWHKVSEQQSEWDATWHSDVEILCAAVVSLTIFCLLVLCLCC